MRRIRPRAEYDGDAGYPSVETEAAGEAEALPEAEVLPEAEAPPQAKAPSQAEAVPRGEAADLSRRTFFTRAAGAAVAMVGAGGVLAGEGETARGAPRPGERKVTVRFPYGTRIPGSGYRADRVVIWTRDKGLADFLGSSKERKGVRKALAKPVAKAKSDVLFDGRELYRFERRLARALARRYRKRTGRGARAPDLMLRVRRGHSGIRTAGVMVRPSIHVKRPSRPRPRP